DLTSAVAAKNVSPGSPTVLGEARHGQPLTVNADGAHWEASGELTYTFQWHRSNGAGWEPIAEAEDPAYTPSLADVGNNLRVAVTGTPQFGAPATVTTGPTGTVQPKVVTPGEIAVVGTARDGQALTINLDEPGWDASGEISFATVWLRCDAHGNDCSTTSHENPKHVLSFADIGLGCVKESEQWLVFFLLVTLLWLQPGWGGRPMLGSACGTPGWSGAAGGCRTPRYIP
ncbi:MAG TPA: hypothetical protein VK054_03780, partial [Beutenbergiaceae bacterium]|nr:hypothetical protein [Beutenbergiaceae bacterium]